MSCVLLIVLRAFVVAICPPEEVVIRPETRFTLGSLIAAAKMVDRAAASCY